MVDDYCRIADFNIFLAGMEDNGTLGWLIEFGLIKQNQRTEQSKQIKEYGSYWRPSGWFGVFNRFWSSNWNPDIDLKALLNSVGVYISNMNRYQCQIFPQVKIQQEDDHLMNKEPAQQFAETLVFIFDRQ